MRGISIAWSIAQYLHENKNKPKTLFATHYHELNEMSKSFERIKNFNVSIKELKDDIIFLRKLKEGGTAHSFGIHVAKMAGMPKQVVQRSKVIMKRLEQAHSSDTKHSIESIIPTQDEMQLSFYRILSYHLRPDHACGAVG